MTTSSRTRGATRLAALLVTAFAAGGLLTGSTLAVSTPAQAGTPSGTPDVFFCGNEPGDVVASVLPDESSIDLDLARVTTACGVNVTGGLTPMVQDVVSTPVGQWVPLPGGIWSASPGGNTVTDMQVVRWVNSSGAVVTTTRAYHFDVGSPTLRGTRTIACQMKPGQPLFLNGLTIEAARQTPGTLRLISAPGAGTWSRVTGGGTAGKSLAWIAPASEGSYTFTLESSGVKYGLTTVNVSVRSDLVQPTVGGTTLAWAFCDGLSNF